MTILQDLKFINAGFLTCALQIISILPLYAQGLPGSRISDHSPLILNVHSGKAPLSTQILGPASFLERGKNWNGRRSIGGTGFHVDWGDGTRYPDFRRKLDGKPDGSDYGSHTYTVPGVYRITASLYYPGPTDAPVYTWKGEAIVEVTGEPLAKSSININAPAGGEVYGYQEFPQLSFDLSTERQAKLQMKLLDQNNNIIGEDEMHQISYNGRNITHNFRPRSYDKYNESLAKNLTTCRIELKLIANNGDILAQTYTPTFSISPESKPSSFGALQLSTQPVMSNGNWGSLILKAEAPSSNPLEVSICHPRMANLTYSSYSIDWGDGSAIETVIKPRPEKSVHYDFVPLKLKHIYPKSGVYKIKFKSNNSDLFKTLDQIPNYETFTVIAGNPKSPKQTTMYPPCE